MSVIAFAGRSSSQVSTSIRSTVQRHTRNFQRHSKRYESTNTTYTKSTRPQASSDASTTNTIPGAGWAWIEPLKTPFYAYGKMQSRSPLLTQLSSTLIIYFLGDLSAQLVAGSGATKTEKQEDGNDGNGNTNKSPPTDGQIPYEPARGLRALVIGGIISIPNYKWFIFLGTHFNYPSHTLSILTKILINQSIFTPCFNTYFFGMQSLLSGATFQEAKERVVDTVPVSFVNSWKVWPAVTAFSFTFLKQPYTRSVFAGVVAIGWQTYLSWLNLKAAEEEEEKRRKGGLLVE